MKAIMAKIITVIVLANAVFVIGMTFGTIRAHQQCREISYRQFIADVRDGLEAGKPFWLAESNIRAVPVLDQLVILKQKPGKMQK